MIFDQQLISTRWRGSSALRCAAQRSWVAAAGREDKGRVHEGGHRAQVRLPEHQTKAIRTRHTLFLLFKRNILS